MPPSRPPRSRPPLRSSAPPPTPAGAFHQAIHHALAAFQRGAWQEAEHVCRTLLARDGEYGPALHLLGVIAGQTQRTQEAVALLSTAVALDPKNGEAHRHLGVALGAFGRHADAIASYDRALALRPDDLESLFSRASALLALGRNAAALASLDRCIEVDPRFAPAHNRRAIALSALGRNEDALASSERALVLASDDVDAHVTRGMALRALHRPAAALDSLDRALALQPELPEAWSNRGNALADLARYDEALECYGRALALRPDYADARFNLSLCALLRGDFERGWEAYESRPRPGHGRGDAFAGIAQWRGDESLRGRTVLLHAEQGLGDTLQFCRYVPLVRAMGAQVVLQVQPTLARLLRSLDDATQVIATDAPLPHVDVRCALMSLPRAFRTDVGTIPAAVPYLRSDPASAAAWQARLGPRTKPRVGIAWSGNSGQARDYSRSMPFDDMRALLHDGIEWISLQKDVRARDAEAFASAGVLDLRDDIHDFADTAAIVELMDVVITVDTSVAHLAGAMGKDVWILLAFNPDWRWLLAREDSPWYPSARLFRQPAPDDWASVMDRVREALRARVS